MEECQLAHGGGGSWGNITDSSLLEWREQLPRISEVAFGTRSSEAQATAATAATGPAEAKGGAKTKKAKAKYE